MLELKAYTKEEISAILGTNSKQGIERKLTRWGVKYIEEGRGRNLTFTITEIDSLFKVYCITELDFYANTDFRKVRNLFYYFFNDDEFMSMPDEVKETRLTNRGKRVSRQAIAHYINKLKAKELIYIDGTDFIYYFAFKGAQTITDHKTYCSAWCSYWTDIDDGFDSRDAIMFMISQYGGVARKQPKVEINGIHREEIEYLCDLIQENIEKEIEA